MIHTHISETPEATAHEILRALLADMATKSAPYAVAFSGGNTPALLFDLWAKHYLHLTPWEQLQIYLVDERCVEWTSPDSNYGNMKAHLLSKVPIPAENIHPIDGTVDPEVEAERYSLAISQQLPTNEGIPVFDAIILGMGDDGHTSSIFPRQEALLTDTRFYVGSSNPYSGQLRVAMTPVLMFTARNLIFHVTGSGKAPALKLLMKNPESGPAAYVAHHSTDAHFYIDQAAASQLEE